MKTSMIGYGTDIVKPYIEEILACNTVDELTAVLKSNWEELCPDAIKQAERLTDEDWQWVIKHNRHAKGKAAKKINDLAGAVLMPETLLRISMLAEHRSVPEGCAYIRMCEVAK